MNLDKLNTLSQKKKIIYTSALFIFLYAIIFYFVAWLNIGQIMVLRKDIIGQKVEQRKKIIEGQNMAKLEQKLKQIEPKLNELDSVFINKNRELEFITTLEGIANNHSIDQNINLDLKILKAGDDISRVPMQISAKGSFQNLEDYLHDLEGIPYYINIDTINLNGSFNSDTYTASINTITYWK